MMPIILPDVIEPRWNEALSCPSIARWRSLAIMCADLSVNCWADRGNVPMCDDLRFLSDMALQHMYDEQPHYSAVDNFTLEEAA